MPEQLLEFLQARGRELRALDVPTLRSFLVTRGEDAATSRARNDTSTASAQLARRRLYPTPRTVWISGGPAAFSFLRRYEM